MFYQWNRKTAWAATGAVTGWDYSNPTGPAWEKINDPSPVGWRVPTSSEIQKLLDANKVSNVWTTQNGVNGRKFTDKATGNSIFLPATGRRNNGDGMINYIGSSAGYWNSTQEEEKKIRFAYYLGFYSVSSSWGKYQCNFGYPIRSVAE